MFLRVCVGVLFLCVPFFFIVSLCTYAFDCVYVYAIVSDFVWFCIYMCVSVGVSLFLFCLLLLLPVCLTMCVLLRLNLGGCEFTCLCVFSSFVFCLSTCLCV